MNKVILMGRLTKDPELKQTATGTKVVAFAVAVDRRYVKQGEERQADFINCVAWRTTAEFIAKYFTKGSMVGLSGSIQTRTWDDAENKRHYVTEVVVEEAYFTNSKSTNGSSSAGVSGGGYPSNPNVSAPSNNSLPAFDVEGFAPLDNDDDLPF